MLLNLSVSEKTINSRQKPYINYNIKNSKIRLIGSSGSQIGILSSQEAMKLAEAEGLDLVMISDRSKPPVCRIINYGKYKFYQDKKAREAKKKQHNASLKEVKMRYKIEKHDYQVRISQAKRFLKSGDKVKATITFKGREIQHMNLAFELLNKMARELMTLAEVQQSPTREGKQMTMIMSPKKKRS
uniref:Translation initiation factor IF-3 n=1 Tax=Neogoniolithon spectabile TaxID=231755 RepID=A0A3G3MGZ4_9FLOR|nr:translation initiation factor 3 [Neogoniolithon spectabile]AYR06104.1 translation initiation factor 3 [Neogoniolithon spectabile]